MFADARRLEDGRAFDCDVCIVGAGPAGIALARTFLSGRKKVLLVEAGGVTFSNDQQELYRGSVVGVRPGAPLEASRDRLFGGTTGRWSGGCGPLDAIDFEKRAWVPLSGWPITFDDLRPYYKRSWDLCDLGLAGFSEGNIDTSAYDSYFEGDFEYRPRYISPPTHFGKKFYAEFDRAENVTVLLHATLVDLAAADGARRVDAAVVKTLNKKAFTIKSQVFILACGGIENARVLLAAPGLTSKGVVNDMTGRCFMQHIYIRSNEFIGSVFCSRMSLREFRQPHVHMIGQLLLGPSDALQHRHKLLNTNFHWSACPSESGYAALKGLQKALRHVVCDRRAFRDFVKVVRDPGGVLSGVRGAFANGAAIPGYVLTEQMPSKDSRVTVGKERDALGVPRAVLDWKISDGDKASVRRVVELFDKALDRRCPGDWVRLPQWVNDGSDWSERSGRDLMDGYHHMGTTRMSDTATTGVVDGTGRVHGVDNLYVLGSSVFPTGGAMNPTLTILALALRLGDRLGGRA